MIAMVVISSIMVNPDFLCIILSMTFISITAFRKGAIFMPGYFPAQRFKHVLPL
jgi:hypothetical protein